MTKDNMQHHVGTILVIDDDVAVREAVADVMLMLRVAVISAKNGREGIDLYRDHLAEIDLILLDLSMPGLSGEETLNELRQLNPDVKVIISSGYSSPERVPQVNANTSLLRKPYDFEKLMAHVRQYLP